MKIYLLPFLLLALSVVQSCKTKERDTKEQPVYEQGTFGYDLNFLKTKDSVIVLSSSNGLAKIVVSPKYQGKVFTSTAKGDSGSSFGWINYSAFKDSLDTHMNAYGGEDRLWLGPEGNKFSLFFKPGTAMDFSNWHTPSAIDHEPWTLIDKDSSKIYLQKDASILNYANKILELRLSRQVGIVLKKDVENIFRTSLDTTVYVVGIQTKNTVTNTGDFEWTKDTGAPCLWNLDMLTPSPGTVIVIPYDESAQGNIATTDYFGQIPSDRILIEKGVVYFKADGKSRGKIGLPAPRTKGISSSYDSQSNTLTITRFDVDKTATYLNQEWSLKKDPFLGDAVNAYNDGPLTDGTQMGPFYELESVSPAAFLKPGESLVHHHAIFHFTGNKNTLDEIAVKTLGVSLSKIESVFK